MSPPAKAHRSVNRKRLIDITSNPLRARFSECDLFALSGPGNYLGNAKAT